MWSILWYEEKCIPLIVDLSSEGKKTTSKQKNKLKVTMISLFLPINEADPNLSMNKLKRTFLHHESNIFKSVM